MGQRVRTIVVAVVASLGLGLAPATALDAEPPATPPPPAVVQDPPTVAGTARYDSVLRATPGRSEPADATRTYRWLRDGAPIGGATASSYRLTTKDVGTRVSVRVSASAPERTTSTADSASVVVGAKKLVVSKKPTVSGTRRYGSTLRASPGSWSSSGLTFSYRWLRDGKSISGATSRSYALRSADVGARIAVRVVARRAHHLSTGVTSVRTGTIKHRRDVRRTITYRVERNGSTASKATFRRLAAQTLADARGWRGKGIRFKEVSRGGSFTLVLAKASRVPSYSSGCSATYSCRVGRNVIINETRWNKGTPVWSKAKRSIRDYRHMVVNHEVGHFLGKGHRSCPGRGAKAPVMQQQSKGLQGCKANPWPLTSELR